MSPFRQRVLWPAPGEEMTSSCLRLVGARRGRGCSRGGWARAGDRVVGDGASEPRERDADLEPEPPATAGSGSMSEAGETLAFCFRA